MVLPLFINSIKEEVKLVFILPDQYVGELLAGPANRVSYFHISKWSWLRMTPLLGSPQFFGNEDAE